MDEAQFRIIVLGAGFSHAAGLPLAPELWTEIRSRASSLTGRAAKFHADLAEYIEFKRKCDGAELAPEDVEFEDFRRFLDIQHFLELRGSDTWSRDGNEGTIVVKTLIGHILAERMPRTIPQLYVEFARKLRPNDYVLTFNYDVLLERALEAAHVPYRLFPDRYSEIHKHSATVDNSKDEVAVLKLHGSIDWFDRSSYAEFQSERRKHGLTKPSEHRLFSAVDELAVTKVLEGPRHPDDPLAEMYRVKEVKKLYDAGPMLFEATPWLLAPSALKIVYAGKLRDFWRGLGRAGTFNLGLAIIGYSLPPHDDYARQVIFKLVTNYQRNDEVFGKRKRRVHLVDLCRNDPARNAFKARYRFVDWNRATLHDSGFNTAAVDRIFADIE
jgi:hypothetical protein